MREIDVRCAVCGVLGRKAVLASTSSFGPPDLDLRPNGPARWALPFKVQRCDACGYCADSIGSAPTNAKDVVESVVYRDVLERSKLPGLARSAVYADHRLRAPADVATLAARWSRHSRFTWGRGEPRGARPRPHGQPPGGPDDPMVVSQKAVRVSPP